jgi:hypothetical protein
MGLADSSYAIQDDLKWLSVENSAIFHDSYVSELFDQLPAFLGTELASPKGPTEEDGYYVSDEKHKRLLEILYATAKVSFDPFIIHGRGS